MGDDRNTTDEFGNETELHEIGRNHFVEQFAYAVFGFLLDMRAEAHAGAAGARFHQFFQPDERAAHDEQDVRGIHADEFLLRMLAAALGRNVGHGTFDDFQQSLLHAFAGHVAGDGRTVGLA